MQWLTKSSPACRRPTIQPRSNLPPYWSKSAASAISKRRASPAQRSKRRRYSRVSARRRPQERSPPNNRIPQLTPFRTSARFEGERNEASIPLSLDAQDDILASILSGRSYLLLQLL